MIRDAGEIDELDLYLPVYAGVAENGNYLMFRKGQELFGALYSGESRALEELERVAKDEEFSTVSLTTHEELKSYLQSLYRQGAAKFFFHGSDHETLQPTVVELEVAATISQIDS